MTHQRDRRDASMPRYKAIRSQRQRMMMPIPAIQKHGSRRGEREAFVTNGTCS